MKRLHPQWKHSPIKTFDNVLYFWALGLWLDLAAPCSIIYLPPDTDTECPSFGGKKLRQQTRNSRLWLTCDQGYIKSCCKVYPYFKNTPQILLNKTPSSNLYYKKKLPLSAHFLKKHPLWAYFISTFWGRFQVSLRVILCLI